MDEWEVRNRKICTCDREEVKERHHLGIVIPDFWFHHHFYKKSLCWNTACNMRICKFPPNAAYTASLCFFVFFFFWIFVTPEGFSTVVANKGLEKARAYLNLFKPGPPGPTALHPLWRMRCKLQVETPSAYTYSLFWAELSGLLGEKIPVAIVGLKPGTPGSVVQRFKHLATKQLEIRAVQEFINSRQKHTSAMLHSDLSGNPRFEHTLTENSRCVTSILARVHRK